LLASTGERFESRAGLAPLFAAARTRLGLIAALFALAAFGWWWTLDQMRGMDNGPWTHLGAAGWFLGVWVVMMAAMMFPSVSPTVALYSRMTREQSIVRPFVFALGYLVTWAAAGAVPGQHVPCERSAARCQQKRQEPGAGPRDQIAGCEQQRQPE